MLGGVEVKRAAMKGQAPRNGTYAFSICASVQLLARNGASGRIVGHCRPMRVGQPWRKRVQPKEAIKGSR